MVFWRSKAAKQPATEDAPKVAAESAPKDSDSGQQSNVVSIASSRLSDRLADVADSPPSVIAKRDDEALILASDPLILPGQASALSAMRDALKDGRSGAHLLLLGAEGTGRRWAAEKLANLCSDDKAAPREWVYVADPDHPTRLAAFAFQRGEGVGFARDVNTAVQKSAAMRLRLMDGDDHRLARELLDEETRQRRDGALEHLRRRAEAQNIAVVKSVDGYVLAPMHEGRMVRPEVFRALPEALQRDVEAKINALEGELQGLVAAGPDAELEASEKYAALTRHVAMSAVKPNLAIVRKLYAKSDSAEKACALVERAFLKWAEASPGSEGAVPNLVLAAEPVAEKQGRKGAPVVKAYSTSRAAFLGEIGHDAMGGLSLRTGHLLQANGGYLIIDGWRLVADAEGWLTLSEVMDQGSFAPQCAPGIAASPERIAFTATLIVVADPQSWDKLKDLDPGAERRFRHVATFATTASSTDVEEAAFAASAGTIASEHGLRALYSSAGSLLYADAVKRGDGRVSLDRTYLLRILEDADSLAASASADNIRSSDVRRAISQHAEVT